MLLFGIAACSPDDYSLGSVDKTPEELVEGLADDDARIMKCRFGEGRYLKELADDEGKTIQAITKRLDRLTNELKEEILDYLEMSSGNFMHK